MRKLPILLGIGRSARGAQSTSKAINPDLKQKVFERDDYTCRCCGFKSKKYQDILFKNGNPEQQDSRNMLTTCIFCHQCFHLDRVSDMRSGVLIWLPEIEQYQLHHIARATYVARIAQGPIAEAARRTFDVLMQRREEVKNRLGSDDPYILSSVLRDYVSPPAYKVRHKKLDGIRLLPLDRRIIKEADLEFNQFPQILAYWRSKDGPFGGRLPKTWVDMYRDVASAQSQDQPSEDQSSDAA